MWHPSIKTENIMTNIIIAIIMITLLVWLTASESKLPFQ
jgi:hypothetical protein